MTEPTRGRLRRWGLPLGVALVGLGFVYAFSDLALLLFAAVLVVYLIEPLVGRLSTEPFRGRVMPRWAAVLIVYTFFAGVVAGSSALFAPMVAQEASALADEVPEIVSEASSTWIPAVNERIAGVRAMLNPVSPAALPRSVARERVADAAESARLHALFASALDPVERELYLTGQLELTADSASDAASDAMLRVRPREDGSLDVTLGGGQVEIRQTGEQTWVLSRVPRNGERVRVDGAAGTPPTIGNAVEASGEQLTELLRLGQRVVGGLLTAIVGIFVTFMVAAFISIDAPRIVHGITTLFPPSDRPALHRLLGRLDHGLSGVIRGQLAICVINAILTGVGLLIFKVKFALLLALIAGVFSLIPIFGTILSTIPAVLLALPQGIGAATMVVVWIIVIHFIEANILQPKIMGETAKVHPALVILALLAGEHAYGVVGALVAVPTVSVLQNLIIFVRDEYAEDEAPAGDADQARGENAADTPLLPPDPDPTPDAPDVPEDP